MMEDAVPLTNSCTCYDREAWRADGGSGRSPPHLASWHLHTFPEILWEIWPILKFSVSRNFPGNMSPLCPFLDRRLEFPIDFQPFQSFQVRFTGYRELKNLHDHRFYRTCDLFASFALGESLNTKTAATECCLLRFWADFAPSHQLLTTRDALWLCSNWPL